MKNQLALFPTAASKFPTVPNQNSNSEETKNNNRPSAPGKQKTRPHADFMTDEALSEMANCERCGETLIKAFINDHVCEDGIKPTNNQQQQSDATNALREKGTRPRQPKPSDVN